MTRDQSTIALAIGVGSALLVAVVLAGILAQGRGGLFTNRASAVPTIVEPLDATPGTSPSSSAQPAAASQPTAQASPLVPGTTLAVPGPADGGAGPSRTQAPPRATPLPTPRPPAPTPPPTPEPTRPPEPTPPPTPTPTPEPTPSVEPPAEPTLCIPTEELPICL